MKTRFAIPLLFLTLTSLACSLLVAPPATLRPPTAAPLPTATLPRITRPEPTLTPPPSPTLEPTAAPQMVDGVSQDMWKKIFVREILNTVPCVAAANCKALVQGR